METTTTTNTEGANFKIAIALDVKTIGLLAVALFVAIAGALFITRS